MDWLGHFEFGKNFKPFQLTDEPFTSQTRDLFSLTYWLEYWTYVYDYLYDFHKHGIIFFDYDNFCSSPTETLEKIAKSLGLEPELLVKLSHKVKPAIRYQTPHQDSLPESTRALYKRLQDISFSN